MRQYQYLCSEWVNWKDKNDLLQLSEILQRMREDLVQIASDIAELVEMANEALREVDTGASRVEEALRQIGP